MFSYLRVIPGSRQRASFVIHKITSKYHLIREQNIHLIFATKYLKYNLHLKYSLHLKYNLHPGVDTRAAEDIWGNISGTGNLY